MSLLRDVGCCVGFPGCWEASLSSELPKCTRPSLRTEAQWLPELEHKEARAGDEYARPSPGTCDLVFRGQELHRGNSKKCPRPGFLFVRFEIWEVILVWLPSMQTPDRQQWCPDLP